VILTTAGGRISDKGGLEGMAEDIAEIWRREWRDPEGTQARLEVEMAGLRADPMAWVRQITSTWPADEREWLEKNSETLSEDMAEATRQGAVGYWLDGRATSQPWHFEVTEIEAPIHVFHGDSDTLAPLPGLRRTLAQASHVTEERIYPGGNHFSPWVTRDRQAAMLAIVTG
jgi:pimeloyl-ACP methyl ester carboxylesterase